MTAKKPEDSGPAFIIGKEKRLVVSTGWDRVTFR
jgi:hypothetical protein